MVQVLPFHLLLHIPNTYLSSPSPLTFSYLHPPLVYGRGLSALVNFLYVHILLLNSLHLKQKTNKQKKIIFHTIMLCNSASKPSRLSILIYYLCLIFLFNQFLVPIPLFPHPFPPPLPLPPLIPLCVYITS